MSGKNRKFVNTSSLNPNKGGLGGLVLMGIGLAVVGAIAWVGFNLLTNGGSQALNSVGLNSLAQQAGLASSLQESIGAINAGEMQENLSGVLGPANYAYTSVTFSKAYYTGDGGVLPGSFTQYVWDEEPENWGNELEIDNDYSTPKNANGQSIDTPLSSTISNSTLTATLATSPITQDASGKMMVTERDYYVHASLTNIPDIFLKVTVPNAGATDATSPTITLDDEVWPMLDKTAWTSSAIDLGVDANKSLDSLTASVSYRIEDNNVTVIKSVKVDDLNKLDDDGDLDSITISFKNFEWSPYVYGVRDDTEYDGASGFDAIERGPAKTGIISTIGGGEQVDLEVDVDVATCNASAADTCASYADHLWNGMTLFTLQIRDIEDNLVVNQAVTG